MDKIIKLEDANLNGWATEYVKRLKPVFYHNEHSRVFPDGRREILSSEPTFELTDLVIGREFRIEIQDEITLKIGSLDKRKYTFHVLTAGNFRELIAESRWSNQEMLLYIVLDQLERLSLDIPLEEIRKKLTDLDSRQDDLDRDIRTHISIDEYYDEDYD
jgi:hypothetical protein